MITAGLQKMVFIRHYGLITGTGAIHVQCHTECMHGMQNWRIAFTLHSAPHWQRASKMTFGVPNLSMLSLSRGRLIPAVTPSVHVLLTAAPISLSTRSAINAVDCQFVEDFARILCLKSRAQKCVNIFRRTATPVNTLGRSRHCRDRFKLMKQ